MNRHDRDALLQATAKTLAWKLYEVAGYGRERTPISVKDFDRELRSAGRRWKATESNLKKERSSKP
jgi:hypothetical protein